MQTYGIWSDAAGGFISGPHYGRGEANEALIPCICGGDYDATIDCLIAAGENDVEEDDGLPTDEEAGVGIAVGLLFILVFIGLLTLPLWI